MAVGKKKSPYWLLARRHGNYYFWLYCFHGRFPVWIDADTNGAKHFESEQEAQEALQQALPFQGYVAELAVIQFGKARAPKGK